MEDDYVYVDDTHFSNIVKVVHYRGCFSCGKPFANEESICAVGKPHNVLIHRHCLFRYDYSVPWQHLRNPAFYEAKTAENHRAGLYHSTYPPLPEFQHAGGPPQIP